MPRHEDRAERLAAVLREALDEEEARRLAALLARKGAKGLSAG